MKNKNHNQSVGDFGENLAIKFLKKRGYKILERNVKMSYKELDIVTAKDGLLIFFEVKTRTNYNFGGVDEAMTPFKLKHLIQAISQYVGINHYPPNEVQLDLLLVDINKKNNSIKIKHYKDLF